MENLTKCRINVMVRNLDRAVDFYTKKLGLQLINQYGQNYAEIQAPSLLIGLHPANDDIIYGNNLSIGISTITFDSTIEKLKAKGIEFKIEDEGWIRLAYFQDDDGNVLYLAENQPE